MQSKNTVRITSLSKSYWIRNINQSISRVVDQLSLEVNFGQSFGLIGPNGAGKTTTVKMIAGLIKPDSGTITLFGEEKLDNSIKKRIGFMPENLHFYPQLTAAEFLFFITRLFDFNKEEAKEKVQQVLDLVGLNKEANRRVNQFSKGMKQKLGLAQSLINDPDLLILDEPLDGLDPISRNEFKKQLISLKEKGKTIFVSSHILSDIEQICDHVAIMDQGKIIDQFATSFLKEEKQDLENYFINRLKVKQKLE